MAVLGYQVVVVSCTLDNDAGRIKSKAMEALIRAKQLGGEEARALTLCSANNQDCLDIEAGLEDEMGDQSRHLRIWGQTRRGALPNMEGLTNKFTNYLNEPQLVNE